MDLRGAAVLLLRHLREQLRPRVLGAHWTTMNVTIPQTESSNLWLRLPSLTLWFVVFILRVVIFFLVVVALLIRSLFQWRVSAVGEPDQTAKATDAVLVLRPFGADGRMTVFPHIVSAHDRWYPRIELIENVIEAAAKSAGRHAVSVRDKEQIIIPRALDYVALSDDWRKHVAEMACQAHSIVLLTPPKAQGGEGLDWELTLLGQEGLRQKVVLLAPPSTDPKADHLISHALETLGWKESAAADQIIVAYLDGSQLVTVRSRDRERSTTNMDEQRDYLDPLEVAFRR